MKEKRRIGRAGRRVGESLVCLAICLAGLWIWTRASEAVAHTVPEEERVSIEGILGKEAWSEEDYLVLGEQTGLSPEALAYMAEQGRTDELRGMQDAYFRRVEVECVPNSIISREEYVVDELGQPTQGMSIPYIEEGDVLVTCCSHVFGWRNGHAAIVVDADRRLVLEAQVLGSPTVITSLKHWEEYPSFLVLRLEGVGREERAAIAAYAKEILTGVPYHVTAGVLDKLSGGGTEAGSGVQEGSKEAPDGTQCAHLVWYAYEHFGYDLDSDGGWIVTPRDLAGSPKLKVIQKYGVK